MKNDQLSLKATKDIFEIRVDIELLTFNKSDVIRYIGYGKGSLDVHFSEMIDSIILKAKKLTEIKTGYRIVNVNQSDEIHNGIYLNHIFFKTSTIITRQLKKSEKAALFLVTIGDGLENWSKNELQKDPVLSYLIDITASVITESVAEYLHQFIHNKMKSAGVNVTNRFSPGYCNWQVKEQHKLFALFPPEFCEVTLMESALMIPEKSISGIIGIGPKVEWKDYVCDKCKAVNCLYKINKLITNPE